VVGLVGLAIAMALMGLFLPMLILLIPLLLIIKIGKRILQ
jgi:hypothetical protein